MTFTSYTNGSAAPLTLNELQAMMLAYRVPFLAFTCSASGYQKLRNLIHQAEIKGRENDVRPLLPGVGTYHFQGVPIYQVLSQEADVRKWDDKESLKLYLKIMNIGEDGDALESAKLERLAIDVNISGAHK